MNYLNLVNDVAQRLNEVELTSSNFASASGVYGNMKQAVNSSIQFINQDNFQWPFNFVSYEETLVAGTARYAYQSNAKWVDFHTFRIKRDNTLGNDTRKLNQLDYEQYLEHSVDDEYNTTDTGIRSIPEVVSQAPNREFVLNPVPDKAYTLEYEYYTKAVDLVAFDDEPTLPADFRHIIVDGAMYYCHLFNSDYEAADRMFQKLERGILNMRKNYSNRYEYVRDTRVVRNSTKLNPQRVSN
jgi:hypothetical protein